MRESGEGVDRGAETVAGDESTEVDRPKRSEPISDADGEATMQLRPGPTPRTGRAPERHGVGLPPMREGSFSLEGEVARGGMGRVVRARDHRLQRVVALKELLQPDPELRARFVREALLTARLQHPSIVPVYEAGRWGSGEPVYSMKLVSGKPLDKAIRAAKSLEERLGLLPRLIAVVDAIAYAHSQRIIHRDLKPSNVILGDFGETVVIDWGLAKELGGPGGELDDVVAELEESGELGPGERGPGAQADGGEGSSAAADGSSPSDGSTLTRAGSIVGTPRYMPPEQAAGEEVDERADVYALGSILYELLVGDAPYSGEANVLHRLVEGPPASLDELAPETPEDLRAIVAKAMARDRRDRYSARELADELRRFQTGKLVQAHAYTTWDHVRRWVLRNRSLVVLAVAAVAVVSVLGILSAVRIVRERDRAEQHRAQSVERTEQLLVIDARRRLKVEPLSALESMLELSPDSRWWSAARMVAAEAARIGVPEVFPDAGKRVEQLEFLSERVVLLFGASSVTHWDLDTGERVTRDLEKHHWVSEGGRFVLELSDQNMRLVAMESGRVHTTQWPGAPPEAVAISPVGAHWAARIGRTMWVADVERGTARTFVIGPGGYMEFSPDGRFLAFAGEQLEQSIELTNLLDVYSWRSRKVPHTQVVGRALFRPNGTHMVVLGKNGIGFMMSLSSKSGWGFAHGMDGRYELARFSDDGDSLIVANVNHRTVLIEVGSSRRWPLGRHQGPIVDVDFLPGGDSVVSAGADGKVIVSRPQWGVLATFHHPEPVTAMAVSPSGRVATASNDGHIRFWSRPSAQTRRLPMDVTAAAFEGHSGALLLGGDNGHVVRWLPGSADLEAVAELSERVEQLHAYRGGLVARSAKTALAWDRVLGVVPLELGTPTALAVSSRGRIAVYDRGTRVVGQELPRGSEFELVDMGSRIESVAIDSKAERVAVTTQDELRVFERTSGRELDVRWRRPRGQVRALAFSEAGTHLAVIVAGTLWVLDIDGGAQVRLGSVASPEVVARLSPDAALLLSTQSPGALDETIQLWDVMSGQDRPLPALGGVSDMQFAKSGTAVRAIIGNELWTWDDDLPRDPAALRRWIEDTLAAARRGLSDTD